ncbi:MAG: hypothetical protein Q9170_008046 [Blastenia crenularia]
MKNTPFVPAKPPPPLSIPPSSSTVDVRFIDTKTLVHLNLPLFWQPQIPNFTGLNAPIYCFLITHASSHIIFDLGVRPDWQNYAPKVKTLISATTTATPGADVASLLKNNTSGLNIRSTDINAVIWSHNHFDHIGDITTFPPNTELVVGAGVRTASWPGWPSNADGGVHDSDKEGRTVREIAFSGFKIGRFDAFDYFGDGSFYLLDAPGHATGHMCGLARTTAEPPSFVFMGADACHHIGVLRPSEYLPLPSATEMPSAPTSTARKGKEAGECAGGELQQLTIDKSPSKPFFTVAKNDLFLDHDAAMETVIKI